MKHFVRLTLISAEAESYAIVERVCARNDWRLLAEVDHAHPLLWLQRQRLDVVLVDLDYPGALSIFAEMTNWSRTMPVIALARPERFAELHEAIQLGAAGFIAKPIDPEQLQTTMVNAMAKMTTENNTGIGRKNLVFVITSLTGGVGKSTIAVNLAIALQQQSKAGVVLAELHGGPGVLAMMQNMRVQRDLSAIAQTRDFDAEVVQNLLHKHSTGIRLLAAPGSIHNMVELEAVQWRSILSALAESSPITVVDTAPIADDALSEILNLASVVLVIARPEVPSIQHAVDLLQIIRSNDTTTAQSHLILNRTKMPGALSEKVIQDKLGVEIYASIPDDPALTSFAVNRGVPFTLSHPSAAVSQRIIKLAQSLIPQQGDGDAAGQRQKRMVEPGHGLLQRLNPLTQQ